MVSQDLSQQYCTFQLDDLVFGVEVLKVQEVLLQQAMTRVPLAPPLVKGLMNLRGQIVPSLDLRERLNLPPVSDKVPMNVVVSTDDGPVSLMVDQIGDVVEIDVEQFEPTPQTVQGITRHIIKGVCKLKDRLLLILDVERAVTLEPEAV